MSGKGHGNKSATLEGAPSIDGSGLRDEDFVKSGWCGNRKRCVTVAKTKDGKGVAVRDSKNPTAGDQLYTNEEWEAFINGVKAGEFDI